jgi:CheY-like chemotaxis protein
MTLRSERVRVLLVEDDRAHAGLTREAFRDANIAVDVDIAATGDAALSNLLSVSRLERPHIIVLDLNLPGKTGHEVLAVLKQHPELRLIPVIVLTGSNNPAEAQQAYALGASCYIRKPMDVDEFFMAIRAIKDLWFKYGTLPNPEALAHSAT